MIRIIFAFLAIFGMFFFGMKAIRKMTRMEQWTLTKYLAYTTLCTVLTITVMTTLVILF